MRRLLFLFTLSILVLHIHAQNGIWSSASVDFKHNKKWKNDIQLIHRYDKDGWSKSGFAFSEYFSPKKFVSLGLQYRWTTFPNQQVNQSNQFLENGNRLQFSVDWKCFRSKKEQNRIAVSWRNAVQMERLIGQQNPVILRSRIKITSPKWRKFRINTQAEYFYLYNAIQYRSDNELIQYGLSKEWRYSASLQVKLNAKNEFQFGYCYSNRLLKQDRQWFMVGFNHEIKRKKESSKSSEAAPLQE